MTGTNVIINVIRSSFTNVRTGITSAVKGFGGAIYIDSTAAQTTINMQDLQFLNVSAAVLGGAVYVESGKYLTQITFDNCVFTSVFSVSGSLIYASFID